MELVRQVLYLVAGMADLAEVEFAPVAGRRMW
jgi:hypothetical protein